jgi:hypothetical protein
MYFNWNSIKITKKNSHFFKIKNKKKIKSLKKPKKKKKPMGGRWSAAHQEPGVAATTLRVVRGHPQKRRGWSHHPQLHIWGGRPASEGFGFLFFCFK